MQLNEPWCSVEEIAKHLGVSKETIYRWLERGTIPSHRMGKLWKFKPSEVDRWVMEGGAEKLDLEDKGA
jgi:excisionase family DNA binding protein